MLVLAWPLPSSVAFSKLFHLSRSLWAFSGLRVYDFLVERKQNRDNIQGQAQNDRNIIVYLISGTLTFGSKRHFCEEVGFLHTLLR